MAHIDSRFQEVTAENIADIIAYNSNYIGCVAHNCKTEVAGIIRKVGVDKRVNRVYFAVEYANGDTAKYMHPSVNNSDLVIQGAESLIEAHELFIKVAKRK